MWVTYHILNLHKNVVHQHHNEMVIKSSGAIKENNRTRLYGVTGETVFHLVYSPLNKKKSL